MWKKKKFSAIVILFWLGAMLLFITNALKLQHWYEVDFNFVSYHPLLLFTTWASWLIFVAVIWYTPEHEHWYIKLSAAAWGVMNLFFSWGLLTTYWGL